MSEDTVETGLVAAAVTMNAPAPEPEPATELTITPARAPMPDGWTLHKVAALVRDMAQNLYEPEVILKKHGLTPEQFALIETNDFYKRALEAEVMSWNSSNSIQRRLALEAAIAVEDALPTVAARLSKGTEPLADVVALLKVLSEIAGVIGAKAQQQIQGAGDKIKIVINLGGDETIVREASPQASAVQPLPEGAGTADALRALVAPAGGTASVRS